MRSLPSAPAGEALARPARAVILHRMWVDATTFKFAWDGDRQFRAGHDNGPPKGVGRIKHSTGLGVGPAVALRMSAVAKVFGCRPKD
jgi:hypothetical protein